MLTAAQQEKKRKLIQLVIGACCALIPLLGYLQSSLLTGEITLPISSTVLILALININGLLLLLMIYLVLRNLVELVFERKQKILGSKLRTKLVASFVALSLVPTALLFVMALSLMYTSMEYWFNTNVEESLQASLKLAQSILKETEKQAESNGNQLRHLLQRGGSGAWNSEMLDNLFHQRVSSSLPGTPDSLTLLNNAQDKVLDVRGARLFSAALPEVASEALRHARENQETAIISQEIARGELVQSISPLRIPGLPGEEYFLITSLLIPSEQFERMETVSQGITGYRQLVMLKAPIKFIMLILLLITTLLTLFGAIWFGFRIAGSLTGPINKLARATRRVADGELDFVLERESDDELGQLVDSFNRMTSDLAASNRKLAEAHQALQESTLIAEQRRRYMETVLENVAAGVIAINEQDEITAINRFAEELLKLDPADFLNRNFHDVLVKPHIAILENFFSELRESGKQFIERHIRVTVRRGDTFSLLVNITRLLDENNLPLGYVIVFDNLTKLEKAQRLAAWQEVARRIAHEIKNPLTPIQLSAQRLRKRYLNNSLEDGKVIEQCTEIIVNQVDEIKRLVSEFSDFARMPQVKKKPENLVAITEDTLILYREAHKHITFSLTHDENIPLFLFDSVQVKRVLINLLENAVKVLPEGGTIAIAIRINREEQLVALEVADTGPGIAEKVKPRLFEPYFSTRKSGTGLGLAIANTIVTEHNGTIRVRDNYPTGAVFTVELPLNS